jgi:hypothetical protein
MKVFFGPKWAAAQWADHSFVDPAGFICCNTLSAETMRQLLCAWIDWINHSFQTDRTFCALFFCWYASFSCTDDIVVVSTFFPVMSFLPFVAFLLVLSPMQKLAVAATVMNAFTFGALHITAAFRAGRVCAQVVRGPFFRHVALLTLLAGIYLKCLFTKKIKEKNNNKNCRALHCMFFIVKKIKKSLQKQERASNRSFSVAKKQERFFL